mmetsp:Transcript_22106/g.67103  ORF Transcript_22106/g.67103 Transcript_22106/m.67103 type:complete len:221 (+) Transcript_22106:186-848(+)
MSEMRSVSPSGATRNRISLNEQTTGPLGWKSGLIPSVVCESPDASMWRWRWTERIASTQPPSLAPTPGAEPLVFHIASISSRIEPVAPGVGRSSEPADAAVASSVSVWTRTSSVSYHEAGISVGTVESAAASCGCWNSAPSTCLLASLRIVRARIRTTRRFTTSTSSFCVLTYSLISASDPRSAGTTPFMRVMASPTRTFFLSSFALEGRSSATVIPSAC